MEENVHSNDWIPGAAADRDAIRNQLERMLKDPLFSHSTRYPNFLRFVVEQTLAGNEALLREHNLGVMVFHRAPDYDTNQDTVVRLAASEVRKRLALYYQQPEHARELQIHLRPHSYVPFFQLPESRQGERQRQESEEAAAPAVEVNHAGQAREPETPPMLGRDNGVTEAAKPRRRLRRWATALLATAVLAATTSAVLIWRHAEEVRYSAENQLWGPILSEPGGVQLIIADLTPRVEVAGSDGDRADQLAQLLQMGGVVSYRDTLALSMLAAYVAQHHRPFEIHLSTEAIYNELQQSANILVGGRSNTWSTRVMAPLRYQMVTLRRGSTTLLAIVDRKHPELGGWSLDITHAPGQTTEDYALVARIFDHTTEQPVLIVAGLGANGTFAAARFVLNPERIEELIPHAPHDWRHLNMEAVIRTQILDNQVGPPHLVTCAFW